MDAGDRRVALVWIYLGRNPSERLETVGSIDGGRMELVAVGNVEVQKAAELFTFSRPEVSVRTVDSVSMDAIWQAVPTDVGAVVFWMDDEKLVHREFPVEMAAPIFADNGGLNSSSTTGTATRWQSHVRRARRFLYRISPYVVTLF